MNRIKTVAFALALSLAGPVIVVAPAAVAQASQAPDRDTTREKLRALLAVEGPKIGVAFHQSTKNPYNFVGSLSQGMKNSDYMEVVISVTAQSTIGFRVYPHYKGHYINLGKVMDNPAFTRKMLYYSDNNFLFAGADAEGDSFFGYTITLESGFPDAAINIVLDSVKNQDQFIGELRPAIDGSTAP